MNRVKKSNADKWFSIFIRLRDAQYGGYCQCCTCGAVWFWKEITCGHFQLRNRSMTRFNEQNCNAQCVSCNKYKKGEQHKHSLYIDNKYGKGTAVKLENLAAIRGQTIHTKLHLKEIAKEYRIKAKEMAEEKGVEL